MAPNPTRFREGRRITFAAAGSVELYAPPEAGDVLNVRQVTVSSEDAAEVVVYYGRTDGERTTPGRLIAGLFLAANGGASPDLSCLGAWSPVPGLPIRVYASAACDVWVAVAGFAE